MGLDLGDGGRARVNLGKPKEGGDHEQKWDYAKFYAEVTILKSQVEKLQEKQLWLEMDAAKHRVALMQMRTAITNALTGLNKGDKV